jgi:hypothetical protein
MDEGGPIPAETLDSLPRIELVSLYMNRYASLGTEDRRSFEGEFARRGLPIPDMSRETTTLSAVQARVAKKPLARGTTISYFLFIYTPSGLVYAWVFLAARLIRHDYDVDHRHKVIQTFISLAYIALETLALALIGAE